MSATEHRTAAGHPSASTSSCPTWCVSRHGVHLGEENWVHTGEPLLVADGIRAVVVMSVDPDTGTADGPYVLIGAHEYTLAEARALWGALLAAVDQAVPPPHLSIAREAMP
ncbi:DUF6907 domain-containing protein [Knoellia sp. CPCC 206435]|uniref:DUF6907 domain-containing protein n=1 Tax=Knoellia terrae TaxID=3404797 RepID=UPI003B427ECC